MLETFEERNAFGQEAVKVTLSKLRDAGVICRETVTQEDWDSVKPYSQEWKAFAEIDEKYGDIWTFAPSYKIEVKRGPVALKTIDNSEADWFVIWNSDLTECRVVNSKLLIMLDRRRYVTLKSGNRGFSYEQLKTVRAETFEIFLKLFENQTI